MLFRSGAGLLLCLRWYSSQYSTVQAAQSNHVEGAGGVADANDDEDEKEDADDEDKATLNRVFVLRKHHM